MKKIFMGTSKNLFSAAILILRLRLRPEPYGSGLRRISQKVLNVAAGYACGLFAHPPCLARRLKISLRKEVFRGALIIFLFFISSVASAQTRSDIVLGGFLSERSHSTDPQTSQNTPLNADGVQINVAIYDTATDGAALWEGVQFVQVQNGVFRMTLEDVPDEIFYENDSLYVGIAVAGDDEMSPRFPLTSSPYAISALNAKTADRALVADALADGSGTSGPKGDRGDVGPQGPAGPSGSAGPTGPTGSAGPAGPMGSAGPVGPIGPAGPAGPMGLMGPAGLTGPAGAEGPMGPAGIQGPAGAIGPHGPQGVAGPSSFDISHYRRKGIAAPERWYTSPSIGTLLTTGAPTANVLRAMPFITTDDITLDRIAISVTTARTSSNARIGIYEDNGNLYPGALVIDAGAVSTASIGVRSLNIGEALEGNKLYWLVMAGSSNPTIRCFNTTGIIPVLGFASTLSADQGYGYSASFAYGALPATFPASASVISAVPLPAIFVRISE